MIWTYISYQRYIIIKKDTEQTQVFTRYIPDISFRTAYTCNIHVIYHVYTMYIPCIYLSRSDIPVTYQEYSLYILDGYP
jgi:hypothetical protein